MHLLQLGGGGGATVGGATVVHDLAAIGADGTAAAGITILNCYGLF